MPPKRAALLRDVVQCIIDSGYAELPQPSKRRNVSRKAAIEVLSLDPRITSHMSRSNFVLYVMETYNVSRNYARQMIYRARRAARAQKSAAR